MPFHPQGLSAAKSDAEDPLPSAGRRCNRIHATPSAARVVAHIWVLLTPTRGIAVFMAQRFPAGTGRKISWGVPCHPADFHLHAWRSRDWRVHHGQAVQEHLAALPPHHRTRSPPETPATPSSAVWSPAVRRPGRMAARTWHAAEPLQRLRGRRRDSAISAVAANRPGRCRPSSRRTGGSRAKLALSGFSREGGTAAARRCSPVNRVRCSARPYCSSWRRYARISPVGLGGRPANVCCAVGGGGDRSHLRLRGSWPAGLILIGFARSCCLRRRMRRSVDQPALTVCSVPAMTTVGVIPIVAWP